MNSSSHNGYSWRHACVSSNLKLSIVAAFLFLMCLMFFFDFSDTSSTSIKSQLQNRIRGFGDIAREDHSTRVVCFGDTHSRHEEIVIPEAEVLVFTGKYACIAKEYKISVSWIQYIDTIVFCYVHITIAGDCTDPGSSVSNEKQIRNFNQWLGTLPHKHKFVVAGNHDPEKGVSLTDLRNLFTNARYLQDESVEIFLSNNRKTLKIYGSPWQPQFEGFLTYKKPGPGKGHIKDLWESSIPESVDIVATHSPPKGHLDAGIGSEDLLDLLESVQPKLNCFGHIHKGRQGKMSGAQRIQDGRTLYVNGAIVNDDLEPIWDPVLVEIP